MAGLLLVFLPACPPRSPTAVAYRVSVGSADGLSRGLLVALELKRPPRHSLTLRAYAAKEVIRIGAFQALGLDGAPLAFEAAFDTVVFERRKQLVPRFFLRGPLPPVVTVRYRVEPGAREGNSHTGYTGRCFGYLGADFGLVTGRNLFLLPQPPEAIRRIRVKFELPERWVAVAPWRMDGDYFTPGVGGRLQAEHLISATIGLGPFREHSFEGGRTRYRLAFAPGLTTEQRQRSAAGVETAARYVRGLFGRDLGPDYLTVVAPRAPNGDEIVGDPWGPGQGRTLAPLTASRLHEFSRALIDAYVRHAPYRREIRRPEEYWLLDGVRNLYSWRAVAVAGLIPEGDITRELALGYLTLIGGQGVDRDLERLYASSDVPRSSREILAPYLLAYLGHELSATTRSGVQLATAIRRTFSGAGNPSFWSLLPESRPGYWRDFRARYVRGAALVPVESFYSPLAALPTPHPPAGEVTRKITLVYTGGTEGYLENCGCKVNQAGGVARRATVIGRILQRDPETIILDAGSAFSRPDKQKELDFLAREEQRLYLKTMEKAGYDAVAMGITELAYGLDYFREQTHGIAIPYLVGNVGAGGEPIAPPSLLLWSHGVQVAVVGVLEPPHGPAAPESFEENTVALKFEDPVELLRRHAPQLKRRGDLVVALGRLTPTTIRRIVETCPDVDVIISTEDDAHASRQIQPDREQLGPDGGGFLGRTLVLYTHLTRYGLCSVQLGLDAESRVASARVEDHWLFPDVPDDPGVRDLLAQFYDRVGKSVLAQASVVPPFVGDSIRMTGGYVGAEPCAGCHAAEFAQWMRTKHAGAFKTLLNLHRHFQPRCVSCHVVGYGARTGYKLGTPDEKLANVQCEVCHGPGARHVAVPARGNILRAVPERVCLACHTPDHSDGFVYVERLPQVLHQPAGDEHAGLSGRPGWPLARREPGRQ